MFEHLVLEIQVFFVFVLNFQYITDVKALAWDMHTNVAGLNCLQWLVRTLAFLYLDLQM